MLRNDSDYNEYRYSRVAEFVAPEAKLQVWKENLKSRSQSELSKNKDTDKQAIRQDLTHVGKWPCSTYRKGIEGSGIQCI